VRTRGEKVCNSKGKHVQVKSVRYGDNVGASPVTCWEQWHGIVHLQTGKGKGKGGTLNSLEEKALEAYWRKSYQKATATKGGNTADRHGEPEVR